jgi:FkbM family methyltransferase
VITSRAKRLAQRALTSAPWLAVVDRIHRRQYRVEGPTSTVWNALLDRVMRLDLAGTEERQHTTVDLIEFFFDLVEAAAVERFVEAGAKDATASIRASRELGIESVVAFEANPFTHRRFVESVRRAGVGYEQLALSDTQGSVSINVRLRPDGSPSADGQASLLLRHDNPPGHESVVVDAVRLDDYFACSPGGRVAMWVDVEGASSVVLRGADRLLEETDVVMIEVEEVPLWDGQEWTRREVVASLGDRGLVPIARDRQSRLQFNIVFVRRDRLGEPAIAATCNRRRS